MPVIERGLPLPDPKGESKSKKEKQLLEIATAAIPLLTEGMFHNCDNAHVPHSEVVGWLFDFAEVMLEEAKQRREKM